MFVADGYWQRQTLEPDPVNTGVGIGQFNNLFTSRTGSLSFIHLEQ
jgi:hypothetical protein